LIASAGALPRLMNATNSVNTVFTPTNEPDFAASSHGTPARYISGANSQPRMRSRLSGAPPTHAAGISPSTALAMNTSANAAISIVAMFQMMAMPSVAPVANASMVEWYLNSDSIAFSSLFTVSGTITSDSATAAGDAVIDTVIKCDRTLGITGCSSVTYTT